MASADQGRLHSVVEALVCRAGYDLEDLTVVAAGRRRLLRVVIDSDAGVDLDDAAAVSRDISAELDALGDAGDPMGDAAYTLEVTSPGIGRPLTRPRHFRRATGRLVSITQAGGADRLGRVLRAGDHQVDLLVGKSGTERLTVPYAEIAKARVEVEFSPPSAQVLALLDAETVEKFQAEKFQAEKIQHDATAALDDQDVDLDDEGVDAPDDESAADEEDRTSG